MIVATAIDREYVEPSSVLLSSIAQNGQIDDAELLIYGLGLTSRDRDNLAKSCGRLAKNLSFVDLKSVEGRLKNLTTTLTVPSVVAYARMLVPPMLPASASRLLYLDSDTLVTGNLRPLFETDLGDAIVTAVQDPTAPWVDLSFRTDVLGLADPHYYFNSGVLLIDVNKWKDEQITEKLFALLERLPPGTRLPFLDQDLLNAVLHGRWLQVERKWNFFATGDDFEKNKDEAVVMHFASGKKPWFKGSTHPGRDIYLEQRRQTPYRDVPLRSLSGKRFKLLVRSPVSTVRNLTERLLGR
jgi:lipopolysaccharide biosynthesis glycosyltransferase